ncbi:hypothetical protein JKL49_03650 [Phenylobacterium sp. 20VBR1]|uniref:Uncharacterized protein n=1 Tax=Phenylobacterium glaciei TaxID=2803784 RepID=A0A941CZK1_9CAUL|nr:hypothetical protein [Phenylobacterium glaciei]MBR7618474.1 hypothetical protein [Phenylobacterium glaciei]QQZ50878.1 hypothetical protein JKL49_06300 [Phenylobacterium glaciei]
MSPALGRAAARGAALFFLAFAAFQVALALGAPYGKVAWGGASPPVLPDNLRAASAGAVVYLVLAAAAMLVRAGDLGARLPQRPFWWVNLVLAIQLALNTLANLAAQSDAERYGMGAASAVGCLLCLGALSVRSRPAAG